MNEGLNIVMAHLPQDPYSTLATTLINVRANIRTNHTHAPSSYVESKQTADDWEYSRSWNVFWSSVNGHAVDRCLRKVPKPRHEIEYLRLSLRAGGLGSSWLHLVSALKCASCVQQRPNPF